MIAVIVFAKAPLPGQVKTRLQPRLSPEQSAALHAALIERTIVVASAAEIGPVELCCAPDSNHPLFARMRDQYCVELTHQDDGDLGARMARALERRIAVNQAAILVGTDCPVMTAGYLRSAADALDAYRVVLGPAEDGGYVLVAARQVVAAMFTTMQWGTDSVLAVTRARLAAAGIAHHELATLWDLDRPADYERYCALGGARA